MKKRRLFAAKKPSIDKKKQMKKKEQNENQFLKVEKLAESSPTMLGNSNFGSSTQLVGYSDLDLSTDKYER